jgi:hypothetical protein
MGVNALDLSNGNSNTAIGAFVLAKDTSGSYNTAIGENAMEWFHATRVDGSPGLIRRT